MSFNFHMISRSVSYAMPNKANISVSSDCKEIGCLNLSEMVEVQCVYSAHIENYRQHVLVSDI